jgi:DNA primase
MSRAVQEAAGRGVELRVVEMPEGEDPAELVAAGGADAFLERLETAVSVLRFQVRRVLADADLDTPAGRDRAMEEAQALIREHTRSRSAERDDLVREIADELDVPPDYVVAGLGPARAESPVAGRRSPGSAAAATPATAALSAERAFLVLCAGAGEPGREYLGRLGEGHFSSEHARRARDHLLASFEDPLSGLAEADPAVAELVTGVVVEAQDATTASDAALRASFLQLELRRIERELRRAAQDGDLTRQDALAGAKQDVRREMDAVMGQTA